MTDMGRDTKSYAGYGVRGLRAEPPWERGGDSTGPLFLPPLMFASLVGSNPCSVLTNKGANWLVR
jgi:hypothetical protein